jgi:hypothetical protein
MGRCIKSLQNMRKAPVSYNFINVLLLNSSKITAFSDPVRPRYSIVAKTASKAIREREF